MSRKFKKVVISMIIFAMTFVNYGLPLQSIASEGKSLFSFGFFHKDEIELKAYFDDDFNNKEKILNVNETVNLTVEVNPQVVGYLETGILELKLKNGNENNFKIQSVMIVEETKLEDSTEIVEEVIETEKEETVEEVIETEQEENIVESEKVQEEQTEKTEDTENVQVKEESTEENSDDLLNAPTEDEIKDSTESIAEGVKEKTAENTVEEPTFDVQSSVLLDSTLSVKANSEEAISNTTSEEIEVEESNESVKEGIEEKEQINDDSTEGATENEKTQIEEVDNVEINEEVVSEEILEENVEEIESYEVKLISENQVQLKNIIKNTKILVEVAYKQGEKIKEEDLFNNILVNLTGSYINENLENIEISQEQELTLGWEYSKEIEVTSNYSKVSPFTVGEHVGTILENIVTVKRNIEDINYLPIKETYIKIEIPKINDKLPIAVNVAANKLMATLGEEVVGAAVIKNNYTYNEENGILEILINNEKLVNGKGEDTFNIVCRYEDYVEGETIKLNKNTYVKVEEYNSNSNIIQEKEIKEEQEIQIKAGELISYFASSTEEKINKGKINANFYTTNNYETEFSNIVNLNILTGDVLEEIIVKPTNDSYVSKDGIVFDATEDIKYKGIKFKRSEIQEMLDKGTTIDLLDENNNVFHTISKENSSCNIGFSEKINMVKIRFNNIQTNGNIQITFVKTIETSKYTPIEFSAFLKLSSKIKTKVKYAGFEESFELKEIETVKEFSESYTQATLSMNRENLSAINNNENVEFKIELNNHLTTSDFYKNPSFEILFPSYVKDVKINNIYTLYQNGLSIKDYEAVNENGINKIKVNFEGTQTEFNASSITNGTNIMVNSNILVDELAPRIKDEIKMYYCNEAVTNYQTQADWHITKEIPEGILKDTNGYDSIGFEYQTPSGLITINSITNYDGSGQTIKSIKQGEKTARIPIQVGAQNSTMELIVLNNTGNECLETVLLGRVPCKGNTDIETGKDLGTNVDTVMNSMISQDASNKNSALIYYSSNPKADKNLDDASNQWSTDCNDFSNVKSFMIVVNGKINPGDVLKYRYNFEIPANLGYDAKILGSFGAFYNNKSENYIAYETSFADKVVLETEPGPKLEAKLSVDVGDGADIAEAKRLKYTVTVNNIGSLEANDLVVKARRPKYTDVVKQQLSSNKGDYGFLVDDENNKEEFEINVGTLNPGQSNSISYYIETKQIPDLEEYADGKDEKGYFCYKVGNENTKEYITDVPDINITNRVTVESSLLTEVIETNEVKNKLVESDFESDIRIDYDREIHKGMESNFTFVFKNISGKDLENVTATFNVEDIYEYRSGKINDAEGDITFDSEKGNVIYNIGKMANNQEIKLTAKMLVKQIKDKAKTVDCFFEVAADGIEKYESTKISQKVIRALLEAKDVSTILPETINENQEIIISTQINNVGELMVEEGVFKANVSEELYVEKVLTSSGIHISTGNGTGVIESSLPYIEKNDDITIDIYLKAKNNEGTEAKIAKIERAIENLDQDVIILEPIEFTILNTEKTEEEKEQEEIEKLKQEYLEEKEQEENKKETEDNKQVNSNNENSIKQQENKPNTENNNIDMENSVLNNTEEFTNKPDTNTKEPEKNTYFITGNAWLDLNKNGTKDNEDEALKGIKVYLLTLDNKMLKTTTTNSAGNYQFNLVENGKYIVATEFDEEKYVVTTYKKNGIPENQNSDFIESDYEEISALTNEILVSNNNVTDIDIGLQKKDVFDLTVKKYISKISLETKKRNEVYEFDNLETAKIEIKAKEVEGAKVTLEYAIVLENVGNIEGYAEQLVDFVDKDLKFDKNLNADWIEGKDGYVYLKDIDDTLLKQGEKKEFKLILTKTMTEENVGTVYNKVTILKTYNSKDETELKENNTGVQNTVILVSTGYTLQMFSIIGFIVAISMAVYVINNKKVIKNKNRKLEINIKKKFYK